jgi:tetratricopeptide (TPR) repeat protein
VARFGYANSEFMLRNWQVAEAAYRRLLDEQPEFAMARNNLALSLLRQRRFAAARREAETALRQSEAQPALQAEIRRTLADIDAASR